MNAAWLAAAWVVVGAIAGLGPRRLRRLTALIAPVLLVALSLLTAQGGPRPDQLGGGAVALPREAAGLLSAAGAALWLCLLLAEELDGRELLGIGAVGGAAVLLLSAGTPLLFGVAALLGAVALTLRWVSAAPSRATLAAGRIAGTGAAALVAAGVLLPAVSPDSQPGVVGGLLVVGVIAIAALVPLTKDLVAIAENGVHKTPLEYFDAVLTLGGVTKTILRWGRVEDRLLNLEALRALVAAYEQERDRARAPTTVTDLCAWLGEQEASQPESRAEDAVTVMTYHGSKGLEWPLVILTDLDDKPKGSAFGAHVVSDHSGDDIDWNDPLQGRWLRFWPWPFGGQKKDVVLDAAAANSDEGNAAARADRAERARLLYVGATRARDYLVLALPKSKSGWPWLDELMSDAGGPAFVAPDVGETIVQVNENPHAVRVAAPVPNEETALAAPSTDFTLPFMKTTPLRCASR